jgi:hypothetical protein
VLISAVAYTARAAPVPALAAVALAAPIPAVVAELKGGAALPLAVTLGTVIVASAAGYAVEDVAAETFAASPTRLAVRRLVRLLVVVAVVALGWVAVEAIAVVTHDAVAVTAHRVAVGAAVAAVASAIAGAVQAGRRLHPGYVGSMAAVGFVAGTTLLAHLYRWSPSLANDRPLRPWISIAVLAATVSAWTWRDPAARAGGLRLRRVLVPTAITFALVFTAGTFLTRS